MDLSIAESLTNYLVDLGKLTQNHADQLLGVDHVHREGVSSYIRSAALISEEDLLSAQVAVMGIARFTESNIPTVPVASEQLSLRFLKQEKILPLEDSEKTMQIAMANPDSNYARHAIELAIGKNTEIVGATASQIERAIEKLYESENEELSSIVEAISTDESEDLFSNIEKLKDLASEAPIVRLVSLIINRAIELSASDIHIEPFEHQLKIRYRIDGVLQDAEAPPFRSTPAVISRLKIIANLNIAERRRPQDGRIAVRVQGRDIDLRVSTVPTLYGESVVMRILDREQINLGFDELGLSTESYPDFFDALDQPNGILLVTGPTGSGKTTTLYACLAELNSSDRKILTVEDPIEYHLGGINQIQVNPQIDVTFASALRSIVRQDPDIIMIGEMRDLETANIATQAALTGHLVLSTLHTNDAGSSITRLLDMGVEDYLLASTVKGILAQRLVRLLCSECKQPREPSIEEQNRFSPLALTQLWDAKACSACRSGYKGRTVIAEFLAIDDEIRKLVLQKADGDTIQKAATNRGMRTIYHDGIRKASLGLTTPAEAIRVSPHNSSNR